MTYNHVFHPTHDTLLKSVISSIAPTYQHIEIVAAKLFLVEFVRTCIKLRRCEAGHELWSVLFFFFFERVKDPAYRLQGEIKSQTRASRQVVNHPTGTA
jgi:hypothetical protein